MGLTQKLGTIPLAVFTDSSNNVGIGAAANASFKLQVTGATNLTGALTGTSADLTSTLSAMATNIQFNLDGTFGANYYTMGFGGVSNGFNRISGGTGTTDGLYITSATGRDIAFRTNGSATTSMLITSGGNVGIGTSSPTAIGNYRSLTLDGVDGSIVDLRLNGSGNGRVFTASDAAVGMESLSTTLPLVFKTNSGGGSTERMRITSGGSVCINATSPGSNSPYLYNFNGDGSRFNAAFEVGVATPGFTSIAFRNPNGTVGSIAINENTVTYGGTSDYRLKEDLKDFSGLDKVSAIKVYDFKWKASEERNEGVLAHELMSVIPYAVNGEKDDINEDGSIKSQMVDYSKLVPVLVKAIQEQQAQIEELKQLIKNK